MLLLRENARILKERQFGDAARDAYKGETAQSCRTFGITQ